MLSPQKMANGNQPKILNCNLLNCPQDHDIATFPYGDEDDDDFEQLVRESEDLEPDAPLLY